MAQYDLIVIGGGSAGFAAATTARQHGVEKILMVEKRRLGYSLCTNEGCMPSKTLLSSADLQQAIERSDALGIEAGQPRPNWPAIQKRLHELVENDFFAARREAILNADIEVEHGHASFVDAHQVTVADRLYTADQIIIATGSIIDVAPIKGLDETGYIDSDRALYLENLPNALVIIGGSYVASELGYLFHNMGVQVTILERKAHILNRLDADLGLMLQEIFRREGLNIMTESHVQEVKRADDGHKVVIVEHKGEKQALKAAEILMATGRRAAVDGLNVARAEVRLNEEGAIPVNLSMQTNVPHIYAIGDVNDQVSLVHAATMEGRVAGLHASGQRCHKMNYDLVADVLFTQPEIGSVGLTEDEAREQGVEIVVAKTPMTDIGKAVAIGRTEGFIKLIAERPSGRILGVHILGSHATDIVQVVLPHLYHQDTVFDILTIPYPHPTLGEAVSYPAQTIADELVPDQKDNQA